MEELGLIKIYFGKVVAINDALKINRCRITIDNFTDVFETDMLPWYFPWYGLNYLPSVDDVVAVIIFDDNFSTGFYGNKIDLVDKGLDADDYETYMELYSKIVDDKQVSITYKKSIGFEIINGISKLNIGTETLSLFLDKLGISIADGTINIGEKNFEPIPLGNKTVDELKAIIKHQNNMFSAMISIFTKIASVCTTPFTAPIATIIATELPKAQLKFSKENTEINTKADSILSEKIYIE